MLRLFVLPAIFSKKDDLCVHMIQTSSRTFQDSVYKDSFGIPNR
jgi:hypothetical protein